MGRPKGKAVGKALAAASVAATSITEIDTQIKKMSPRMKALYEALVSGEVELTSALMGGYADWFTGITKVVHTKEGDRLLTDDVTLANYKDLDDASYARLNSICISKVRQLAGTDDYRQYALPLKEYVSRFSILALGTVMEIMQNGKKEEVRLRAANSLLDRELGKEREKDTIIPVQVNIMLTGNDGTISKFGPSN